MHTGEMSSKRAAERMVERYRDTKDFLLIVTRTVGQMEGLLKRLDDLTEIVLATTLERAKSDPWGPIWRATDGEEVGLPKS